MNPTFLISLECIAKILFKFYVMHFIPKYSIIMFRIRFDVQFSNFHFTKKWFSMYGSDADLNR